MLQTKVLEKTGTNFGYSLVDSYIHFKYEFVYAFRAEGSMRQ
jgi:hypothetical protein